ncbi:hypothetical protein NEOLEDRAFT_306479 [Neolentinus lepideus HHB14362 ss-1]|uniref:Uncharacterized protein n=1 Tax=Neolentinus lepideus HHB14362 ss-1 TaxID=1314782 RepID=A0A165VRF8_9AGAM|nr:hypothetical protein NEOLEDRAFT_306479 [Neolentinus lepideus HHB14362 ss-1]
MDTKSAPEYLITNQPMTPAGLNLYTSPTLNPKNGHHSYFSPHHQPHMRHANKRWLLVPALLAILSLIMVACVALAQSDSTLSGLLFGYDDLGEELVKRATGDNAGSNNGTFVNRKCMFNPYTLGRRSPHTCLDYLIIVFVGLFLVVLASIMLSFWCCRGTHRSHVTCNILRRPRFRLLRESVVLPMLSLRLLWWPWLLGMHWLRTLCRRCRKRLIPSFI